jgi:hypothetical protein
MNGRTWMAVHSIDRGEANDIGATLARLDGTKFYSLLLWKLPPGKSLYDVSPDEDANEYVQCAGSADRMTVEVRRLKGDMYEQFVVGPAPNSEILETRRPSTGGMWTPWLLLMRFFLQTKPQNCSGPTTRRDGCRPATFSGLYRFDEGKEFVALQAVTLPTFCG